MDYRFSIFGTNVYPRGMYAKVRDFIVSTHGSFALSGFSSQGASFEEIMANTEESWAIPVKPGEAVADAASSCTLEDREMLLPDFAFMDAFMW